MLQLQQLRTNVRYAISHLGSCLFLSLTRHAGWAKNKPQTFVHIFAREPGLTQSSVMFPYWSEASFFRLPTKALVNLLLLLVFVTFTFRKVM